MKTERMARGAAAKHVTTIARACEMLEHAAEPLTLEALARAAGLSPFHFHRVFRKTTGLTPRAYAAARRAERVRAQLMKRDTVTEAIYGAGFNSSGRFYAQSHALLGMTPRAFRARGAGETIRYAVAPCALGLVMVAATERGVCTIALGDDAQALADAVRTRYAAAQFVGEDERLREWVAAVVAYIETPATSLDLPLDVRGTAFQHRVWQALMKIPPGSTASYREIAESIGAGKAARAVARACASNELAVAIPCHRVVRGTGALSGYRWGPERKRELLAREKAASLRRKTKRTA